MDLNDTFECSSVSGAGRDLVLEVLEDMGGRLNKQDDARSQPTGIITNCSDR